MEKEVDQNAHHNDYRHHLLQKIASKGMVTLQARITLYMNKLLEYKWIAHLSPLANTQAYQMYSLYTIHVSLSNMDCGYFLLNSDL